MTHTVPPIVAAFRNHRRAAGLSRHQVAELLHTRWAAIRDFERGRCAMVVVKLEARFRVVGRELAAVPIDPLVRAQEYAAWLQAQGWSVEGPNGD